MAQWEVCITLIVDADNEQAARETAKQHPIKDWSIDNITCISEEVIDA